MIVLMMISVIKSHIEGSRIYIYLLFTFLCVNKKNHSLVFKNVFTYD